MDDEIRNKQLDVLEGILHALNGSPVNFSKLTGNDLANNKGAMIRTRNVIDNFREAFENYVPNGERWEEITADGDIITLDGNTAAASYLVMSINPLRKGGTSSITTKVRFNMPVEVAVGLSISQRILGQEVALELVDDDFGPTYPSLDIDSIQSVGAVLTVNTVLPHGLLPGRRIGISGVSDNRLNYPSLVVDSVNSATQFTVTNGPMGTIASLSIGPFVGGKVYYRSSLGNASNGTSQLFEQGTSTSASFFVRSESGDVLPSGSITGNHSVTIGTSSSVQSVARNRAYSFQPSTEYRLIATSDKIQWADGPMDTVSGQTGRSTRTQVVPSPLKEYKLRIRAISLESQSVPIARVVSVTKAGSATATVTTDVPHGLVVGNFIAIAGQRDQTNFVNIATPTAVVSVISPTQFTCVYGGSFTGSTRGGFVTLVQGAATSFGVIGQTIQSVSITGNAMTLVGSASWTGLLPGDYVNILGVLDITTGADLNLDGAYRVQALSTTTLILEPIQANVVLPNLALTSCGGGVIKRTDVRISYVRIMDFERHRVEHVSRPNSDIASSVPVTVNNAMGIFGSGTIDQPVGSPVAVGGRAQNGTYAAMSAAGDLVPWVFTMNGVALIKPYALPESEWNYGGVLTTTADVTIQAAVSTFKRHITSLWAINTGAATVELLIKDGLTERARYTLPVGVPVPVVFPTGLLTTINTALNASLSAAGTVRLNVTGYTAP